MLEYYYYFNWYMLGLFSWYYLFLVIWYGYVDAFVKGRFIMKRYAPKILLLAFCILLVQVSTVLSGSVCSDKEVVGPEAMARTWISARQIARTEWASAVRSRLGRSYHKWNFAHKRGYMCWASGRQKYCKASATPCNGRNRPVASFSDRDNPRTANDRSSRKNQNYARGEDSRDNNSYFSNDDGNNVSEKTPLRARRGYLDKRLVDQYSGNRKCASRPTRISGKVSYGLEVARESAQNLWSEYVGITQGNQWSGWKNAQGRHVKCSPSGSRVKCEVSANACLSGGRLNRGQRVEDNARRQDNRISLPVRRPDIEDFAYDERSQDPGEYGDGNVGDSEGRMELPEKKDGFSLPWLVEPPVGRPEPNDGEGGPFGSGETSDDFDISSLDKRRQGQDSSQDKMRSKRKQGLAAPALPVKRPVFDDMQAMLEQQNNYYSRDGNSGQVFQEDMRKNNLNRTARMTLPQRRPRRNKTGKNKAERRFSQNFNTDNDEGEPAQKRPRKKRSQNWNNDEEQPSQVRKDSDRFRESRDGQDDARRDRFQGRSRDRKNIENSGEKDTGQSRPGKRERSGSRSRRPRQGASGKQQNQGKKEFQGWRAEEDADRNIVRRRGKYQASKLPSWKRKKKKSDKLALADSKIRYTSNAAVLRNPNIFYGCKEEEVASWGKPQPTKPQARQQAIRNWQKVIYNKYGKNWSDWMKAGSSRVQCGSQNGMKKCVAIASPCGAIMPKRSDAYNSVARCRIYPVSYSGNSSKNLAQARQNAMNVWEKKTEKKYGLKWSDWFRSMEHSIKCSKKSGGKKRCRATAIPCSI